MRKSIIIMMVLLALPAIADDAKIAAEWQLLREELRKQGYPVASRVEGRREIAADMERVRREMQRRAGKAPVSDMQRIGGGGGPVIVHPRPRGLQIGSLRK
jgi:hypothetical protein